MIIDSLMKFFEDEAFTANVGSGTIDLYGTAIAVAPNSELPKVHGRGSGSPVLVHAVVKAVGGTLTAMTGTVTCILKIEDATPATVTVATLVFPATLWTSNEGVHMVFAMPYDVEGRYATLDINDASLVGGGSANVCDAWLSPQ